MLTWLIDTGPLVAFFDRGDSEHEDVNHRLADFRGRLCTTGAVIGEAMHFLPDVQGGPEKLSEFVSSSGVNVFECTQPHQLQAAVALMKRYRDTPMDFADATLVCLADELSTADILTLDRRGFRTYRTARRKSFNLLLR
jgi:predicted nucleic acid-binding protein